MTDTLHKNPESRTGSDTPETDIEASNGSLCDQCVPAEFARKLERERDEAINACHIWQRGHSKLVEDRDEWKLFAVEQEKKISKQLTLLQEHGLAEYGN